MSQLTVNQIMQSIAATVNQESSAPTTGGSEWSLWLEYINRAVSEWSEAADWEVLRKIFFPSVNGVNQATVSLPLDYKKLAAAPRLHTSEFATTNGKEYPDITFEQKGLQDGLNTEYVYETGDYSTGKSLVFSPGTLASGASISIPYFSFPTSLASPAQTLVVPDSQYVIDRTIGYILEARSDPRFQQQEVKAREKLLQMIENQNDAKFSSYGNPNYVISGPLRKMGFRVGRD